MSSSTRLWTFFLMGTLLLSLCVFTQTSQADAANRVEHSANDLVEELVVTGKRPGPPLWRVSNNGSTLWIFGVPDTLPKKLVWDPASVNAIMQDSQAYLSPPDISASVSNPLRAIGVLRAFGKLKKLDNNQQLHNVVPDPLYTQFTAAAAQFRLPLRRTKKLRPMYAAEALTEQALKKSGLRDSEHLEEQIRKIAKRRKVPVISSSRSIDMDKLFEILESPSLEAELACLQITVEAVATDLQQAVLRAQAWADGDALLLSSLDYPDVNSSCVQNLFSSPAAVAVMAQANQAWLTSATRVLATHETSFASLPMRELVREDGLLKQLEQRGFKIRGQ